MEPRARNPLVLALRGLVNTLVEPPSLGAIILRDFFAMGLPRALALFWAMVTDRIEVNLRSVSVPTHIVRGERDPLVSRRWAQRLAAIAPHGRVAVIPDAGHALNYNAPDRVAALLESMIRKPRAIARAPLAPRARIPR
jgi:pimeloyl-ACP methyl ester carboxylesterase